MFRQLMTTNRFVSLAPDDPDNSETETEPAEPRITDKPQDDVSAVGDDTVFYDANDDTVLPISKQVLNPPRVSSGKLQRLLISMMSMECCVSAINWTKPSGPL